MPKNFICHRCKKAFPDNAKLQRHYNIKKPCVAVGTIVELPEWRCEPCNTSFSSNGNLKAHLETQVHKRTVLADGVPIAEGVCESGSSNEELSVDESEPVDNTDINVAGPSNSDVDIVLPKLDTRRIRKTNDNPPKIAVFDLIAVITGQSEHARKIYSRLVQQYSEVKALVTLYKFKGRGQRCTPVISISDVDRISKSLVPGLRIPLARKQALLGIHQPLRKFTEIEIHDKLARALRQFNCVQQYRTGKYRLDIYFPRERVAVECDEHGHIGYNQDKEKERHAAITSQLSCTWIRYDPYDSSFDIFDLINEVLEALLMNSSRLIDSSFSCLDIRTMEQKDEK